LGFHLAVIVLTSPIKGRDTLLLARDLLQTIRKKQDRWIRPIKKQNEAIELQRLGKVDWGIPGHQRVLDIPQAKDIVEWSQHLGVIDAKKRNMWTTFGVILNKITESHQKDAFLCRVELPNPLRLTLRQKFFFLYLILHAEGDFMIPFIGKLPKEGKFSASEAVNYFFATWKELATKLQSSKDYADISEGKDLSRRISQLKPVSAYERVKSKLENLIDLGILTRVDERKYNYLSNTEKLRRLDKIPSDTSFQVTGEPLEKEWRSFFDSQFFSLASDVFEIGGTSKSSDEVVTKRVLESYSQLVGGLGLCRIDEICLFTGIEALNSTPPVIIEQKDARNAIYNLNRKHRKLVSLHVDMLGNISYAKIDKEVLNKV